MKFKLMLIGLLLQGLPAHAGTEQMKSMPLLKETKAHSVPSVQAGEDLKNERGFGDQEPAVKMMNLMMVEGSGYEGMDMGGKAMGSKAMGGMKMDHPKKEAFTVDLKKSPPIAKVGSNLYTFTVKDLDGKELKNLKLTAQVYMTSMDMGTETPAVQEVKPGLYQIKAAFSMKGPWAIKIMNALGEKLLPIQVGSP